MKAAVVKKKDVMVLEDIPIPEINDETMLVRVESCAICGSDQRIFHKGDARAKYPIVIGHEIAGVIEKLGKNVSGLEEGDRVCIAPGHGCGECVYCKKGCGNVCINPCPSIGYASNGGFAQYVVPPVNVVRNGFVNKIPSKLSFDEASMAELLACCINAQERARVGEGDTVLIMGAGPAGCMHVQLARARGATKVMIAQRSQYRLDLAKRFSPDVIINSKEENLEERLREETDGIGADVIIVAAPSAAAQEQAMRMIAPRGRINFFGGLPKDDCEITINGNIVHYIECELTGASSSLGRQNREALELIVDGKINASDYITHTLSIDAIEEGFDIVGQRKGLKVVIKPWE